MVDVKVDKVFIRRMQQFRVPDKKLGLIEACSQNVVVFSEFMLGLKLYSWQVHFLNKIQEAMAKGKKLSAKEFLALTSRQIGKSTAVAILGLWASVFNKYPGTLSNNTSFLIVSASDVQAKKLLYEMKKFIKMGDRHMERKYRDDCDKPQFGKEFFSRLLDENEPNNTTTITFKPYKKSKHGFLLKDSLSGSTVKSYPPTSSVLGETASVVVVDEAGMSDKISDQFFYDYLYPTGNSTNAIRIYLSTPWACSGFFYRLVDPDGFYNDTPADVVVFTIDAIHKEAQEYYDTVMRTVNQMNKDGKQDEVQRAYYCRFVKGEKSYFKPTKIFSMFDEDYQQSASDIEFCDLGVDFGGQAISRTVLTISKLTKEGIVKRIYKRTYEVGKDNGLIADIEELKTRFNIQRIIPDECPQGDYLIREMVEKGWDVQPMNFRTDKVKKYGAFRSMLNKGEIMSFPDEELKTEMLAMELTSGSRQSLIQHAPGYTDDLIDSFILSTYFYLVEEGGVKFYDYEVEKKGNIFQRWRHEPKYEGKNEL